MQKSSGLLILIVGLAVLYLGITGRYKCLTEFLSCMTTGSGCSCNDGSAAKSSIAEPLKPLSPLGR